MGALGDARGAVVGLQHAEAAARAGIASALGRASGAVAVLKQRDAEAEAELRRTAGAVVSEGFEEFASWEDRRWLNWRCPSRVPDEIRVGEIAHPGGALPATVPIFGEPTIVIATESEEAAKHARGVLRSISVRLAAAMGDRVVLHLIDPHQGGFGFPERSSLPQDAPRTADVARDLDAVIKAGFDFQRRYDARAFRDLARGEIDAESLHVVLAMDYPRGYGHQANQHLNQIARLGPAGVQLIVHHDLTVPEPGEGLRLQHPVVIDVGPTGSVSGPWGSLSGPADHPPHAGVLGAISEGLPVSVNTADSDGSVGWAAVNPDDPALWWSESAAGEARAVVGRDTAGQPLELAFGQDGRGTSRSHMVVAGEPGAGKGVLLHSAILSLATRYRPDDLRFILIDGQEGVTMQDYVGLPHADLVSIQTPSDLARQVIADVGSELRRRDALLLQAGVESIGQYRAARPGTEMPRLVVVIDEYQTFLADDREDVAIGALRQIAAQGRKVGVHLLLASQRFHATGLLNQGALFDNIQTRLCLRMPTDAIDRIDEFDREGRDLIRRHCSERGRVVRNDAGGAAGHSVAGYVAFAEPDARKVWVDLLRDKARVAGLESTPEVFDARRPAVPRTSRALGRLASVDVADAAAVERWAESDARGGGLAATEWQPYDNPFAFLAGRSFSIYGSAFAKVDRAADHNVMVVANDAEVLGGIMLTGLVAAGMSSARSTMSVSVLSELPPPGAWAGLLTRDLPELLGARGHLVRVAQSAESAAMLAAKAVEEIERRNALPPIELAALGPYLVVAAGLERISAFRNVDGRYGPESSEAGGHLRQVLTAGPYVGVHAVLATTSRAQWVQVMPDKAYRHFVHRFFQQMSADDSRALLNASHANKVTPAGIDGQQRAAYQHRETGVHYRFLPYAAGHALVDALRDFVNVGGERA
ncbi:DNA translocase FtsK [Nocardioides immobilis]|uniref:DNA translocase FtsK n=1 Tax=Nocardioides immobilis TaxID=2049295 RepID=A0A417XYI4_9ACTN|nr:FtsK/SpoIIIE domain-containing protein [Nocardioides immobilis]RHW25423.1 DNA translocase FtsK [Nocardioides immobilis]